MGCHIIHRRRGVVLPLVLLIVAMVATVGVTFMATHTLDGTRAENVRNTTRAIALAESGIELALYQLIHMPDNDWDGVTGLRIDGSGDTIDVQILEGSDEILITSRGSVADTSGTVRSVRTIQCSVRPGDRYFDFEHALLVGTDLDIPVGTWIGGNVHANGDIDSEGRCFGVASAQGSIDFDDETGLIDSLEFQPERFVPQPQPADYFTYIVDGRHCQAEETYSDDLYSSSHFCQGWVPNANNPGRIILTNEHTPNLSVHTNVNIYGTLVVRNDLTIHGTNIQITAAPGYPALVVGDDIIFDDNTVLIVNGTVIVGDDLKTDGGHPPAYVQINGALICHHGDLDMDLDHAPVRLVYVADQARPIDLTGQADSPYTTVTITGWQDWSVAKLEPQP